MPHEKARREYTPREKTQDKPGLKAGDPGGQLARRTPTRTISRSTKKCDTCNISLKGVAPSSLDTRQVIDTKTVLEVKDYVYETIECCNCHQLNKLDIDPAHKAQVSYGPNIKSAAVSMGKASELPLREVTQILSNTLGVKLKSSTVQYWAERASDHQLQ